MSSANIIHCLSIRFELAYEVTSTPEYYVMDMVYYSLLDMTGS